jgi:hypothetical protein
MTVYHLLPPNDEEWTERRSEWRGKHQSTGASAGGGIAHDLMIEIG